MQVQPKPRVMNLSVYELKEIYDQMLQRGAVKSRAVFLDRDGTINEERGYLQDPELVNILPTVSRALTYAKEMGFLIVVITNQSAIGRGLIQHEKFLDVNTEIWNQLQATGAGYHGIYYCPHDPTTTACECRKPKPGLLFQAAIDFGIQLNKSYFVGDKTSDLEAGQSAGCITVLCRTGFGKRTEKVLDKERSYPDYIGNRLLDIVEWINQDDKHR